MSRTLHADVQAAIGTGQVTLVALVALDFESGIVRAHSGVGDLDYNGDTYKGVGTLGAISEIEEGSEPQAYPVQLQISGVDPLNISLALNDQYQGRDAKIWLAFMDENHEIKGDPVLVYEGRMDTITGSIGDTATLSLQVQSRLADWERPKIRRYTDQDQQAEYPGDKGLEFVAKTTRQEVIWGRA